MRCAWFKCGAEFSPSRDARRFCCKAHQEAEANWRAVRGKAVVVPLIEWYRMRHASPAQRKAWSIANGRPAPTITQVQRIVKGWIAELEGGTDA